MRRRQNSPTVAAILIAAGIVTLAVVATNPAFAAGLVPCEGPDCTICHFFELANTIYTRVLLFFTPILGGAAIAVGGLMIIFGGAKPDMVSKGKNVIQTAVIGAAIVFASFIIVNAVIQAVGADQDIAEGWFKFECVLTQREEPDEPLVVDQCTPEALTEKFGGLGQANEPVLVQMMNCILADPVVTRLADQGSLFTFERTQPLCNLTKGNLVPQCGILDCAHQVFSCHYGGSQRGRGAMAVDFNARDGSERGERALFDAINKRKNQCGFSSSLFEATGGGFHTHINAPGCSGGN